MIEDALNKAKTNRGNALTVVSNNEYLKSHEDDESRLSKRKVRFDTKTQLTTINHASSVKEIALMKNTELLKSDELSELKIIFSDMPDNKIADVYRDLRTKIIQASKTKVVSVMLTSCVPGYYSTPTALNMAAAFSLDESKTSLLIDCNLNNPQLDKRLGFLDGTDGLTDYLEDEGCTVDSILQESGIKRLRVISAGQSRETATEYFTSLRMRELMSSLLTRYSDRYLFLDAAPVVDSADTRILVELCDYVVMVVPYGKATRNRVKEAAKAIGEDKLLGVIFADKPAVPKFSTIKNAKSNSLKKYDEKNIFHDFINKLLKMAH